MDILDVLKSRLPDGLEIVSVKDKPYCTKYYIKFHIGNIDIDGELPKAVPLGKENDVVDSAIRPTMANYYWQCGKIEEAQKWLTPVKLGDKVSKPRKAKKDSQYSVKLDSETERKLEKYCQRYAITKEEAIIKAVNILFEIENK